MRTPRSRGTVGLIGGLTIAAIVTAIVAINTGSPFHGTRADAADIGIQKIKHVIVIMQENRSFDSYFGTFPGADGIPMTNGVPTVSAYDPATGQYVQPYHNTSDFDTDGP